MMLDGEDDNSNSNQDLAMLEDLHGEISGDIKKMMDQQFAHPTHASVGEDFMGLEDTLNNVLWWLGDTVVFDPSAQKVKAPNHNKDTILYDHILWAQTIEVRRKARAAMELLHQPTPHCTLMDPCLEGAQKGTKCMKKWKSTKPITGNLMLLFPTILQSQIFFGIKEWR
jgi:hypothetical protein